MTANEDNDKNIQITMKDILKRSSARQAGIPAPPIKDINTRKLKPQSKHLTPPQPPTSTIASSSNYSPLDRSPIKLVDDMEGEQMIEIDQPRSQNINNEYPIFTRITDDPIPPLGTASDIQKQSYITAVKEYAREMLDTYHLTKMKGERLWLNVRTSFRPSSIRLWSRPVITLWADFFIERDVFVDESGKKNRASAIIDLLYRPHHINPSRRDRITSTAKNEIRSTEKRERDIKRTEISNTESQVIIIK